MGTDPDAWRLSRPAVPERAVRSPRRVVRAVVLALPVLLAGCGRDVPAAFAGADPARGREAFAARGCGTCHAIDGVAGARGRVGPPLDGVAARQYLAGTLPNTPDNLMHWIRDPQAINPRTAMPSLGVGADEARDIAAFLYTQVD